MQMRGQLSTKNYNYGRYEHFEDVSGEVLAEDFNIVNKGCLTCPIKCARTVEVEGKAVKGPELETLGLLGGGILNNDMYSILKWNYELDELGMDTISASSTLGYATEACEKGLWDNGLKFGPDDEGKISKIWEDIAYRRGIGDELANGSRWCSEKYGGKEFANHSKGMELAAYEPRRAVGLGLGYAISNRGGCHLNGGYMILVEGLSLSVNQQTPKAKPDFTVIFQDLMEFVSSCGECLFTTYAFFPTVLMKKPNSWITRTVNKYTIKIYREQETESLKYNSNIKSLLINNHEIEFLSSIYEYDVVLNENEKKLKYLNSSSGSSYSGGSHSSGGSSYSGGGHSSGGYSGGSWLSGWLMTLRSLSCT